MAHRLVSLLVVGVLAFPVFVLADATSGSGTLTITESLDPNETTKTINAAECSGADADGNPVTDNITVAWSFTTGFVSGDPIRIDVSTASGCSTTTAGVFTATLVAAATITNPTATDQWPRSSDTTNKIPAGSLVTTLPSGAGVSCSTSSTTLYLCAVDVMQNIQLSNSIALTTTKPAAPTGVQVVGPGDGALYLSWNVVSGTGITYTIRATPTTSGTPQPPDSTGHTGTTQERIDGLTNGVTYSVVVFAVDNVKNRSAGSSPAVTGTPEPVDDFWRRYKDAGGVEPGGCAAGPAGPLALLLLPLLFLRRRRS